MEEFLCKLLETALKNEVLSDFDGLPKERCGAISLSRCMVNCMVIKNKESHHNIEKWLKDFNLTYFPGKNITKATLHIKAIAIANTIGHDKLPLDIVTRVLHVLITVPNTNHNAEQLL